MTKPKTTTKAAPAKAAMATVAEPAVEIGAMVRYTMRSGIERPAIVVAVDFETINLQVFVDGNNDGYSADQVAVWVQGAAYSAGKEPGTWH